VDAVAANTVVIVVVVVEVVFVVSRLPAAEALVVRGAGMAKDREVNMDDVATARTEAAADFVVKCRSCISAATHDETKQNTT